MSSLDATVPAAQAGTVAPAGGAVRRGAEDQVTAQEAAEGLDGVRRLAQASGTRFGLLQPLLYAGVSPGTDVAGFRDITSGNNGAYSAGPGWDPCTGLGVPDGAALVRLGIEDWDRR